MRALVFVKRALIPIYTYILVWRAGGFYVTLMSNLFTSFSVTSFSVTNVLVLHKVMSMIVLVLQFSVLGLRADLTFM